MVETIKVSSKGQIVIPKHLREDLDIQAGDELLVMRNGQILVMVKRPSSYVDALSGLGRRVWQGVDVQQYLDESREDREEPEAR